MKTMTKLLTVFAILALCAGVAAAGCGHKDTTKGTVKAVDTEKNQVVVAGEDGEEVMLTLTEATEVMDADGNVIEVSELVGMEVVVVSEHAKIDSIKQSA